MKLQLALDVLDAEQALSLAEMTREAVDIIEIGTPLMKYAGVTILRKMRDRFPEKAILVDLKTMDVGEYESSFCFDQGADIVTVLGVADSETIRGSIRAGQRFGGKVMVDLINHPDKVARTREVEEMGADFVGIHTGIDQQARGITPLSDLRSVRQASAMPIMVAGGINQQTIGHIARETPDTIVVGGAITGSAHPGEAALQLKEALR